MGGLDFKNSRISAWESQKGFEKWTFLECPKSKRRKRLSQKHVFYCIIEFYGKVTKKII